MRSNINIIVVSLIVSGCAVQAITPDAARSFRGVSIDNFLSSRFTDPQSKMVKGNFLYEAFFNGTNYRQLERPVTELSSFCSANEGKLSNIAPFKGNPLGKYIADPLKWADNLRRIQQANNAALSGTAAEVGYDLAVDFNSTFKTLEAKQAYQKASAKGAFGTLECKLPNGDSWRTAILPVGFKLKEANNDLSNNMMVLQISKL